MKRIVAYVLILAVVSLLPTKRQDIGDLEPIQAVSLSRDGEQILLETDTEDRGVGSTVQEALENMKHSSLGIVYLDTAQFLLVTADSQDTVEQMIPLLKGSVKVCLWEREGKVQEAARYMQAHESGVLLRHWKPEIELPKIPL